jgi:hypothetical protein
MSYVLSMKPLIVGLTVLLLATAAQAQMESANGGHDGGPKAHDGGMGGGQDSGNDFDNDCQCRLGRLTPIGTDENGNPSTDTPGLGPDWDPQRDDAYAPDDPETDWGWDE